MFRFAVAVAALVAAAAFSPARLSSRTSLKMSAEGLPGATAVSLSWVI